MPRIVPSREVEVDILGIFVHIGRHSEKAANRFLQALDKALKNLAAMAYLGGQCESDHPSLAGVRAWPIPKFRKYMILYRPLADGIEVLRVIHGARDIDALFH
jgi:toxin ParE1/3/4